MRTLESTAAQSLDTFASLLIEFVARLDRLVEAVDELSKMAKFQHENSQMKMSAYTEIDLILITRNLIT